MSRPLSVLIVEDSPDDAELLLLELRRGGFEVVSERVQTAQAMSAALEARSWDIVLCDESMPRFDAPAALALLRGKGLDLAFIIVSGTIGEETAVEAMRAGAHDYFIKGKLGPRFIAAIDREVSLARTRRERAQIAAALALSRERIALLLGASHFVLYSCEASGDFDATYVSDNIEHVLGYTPREFLVPGFWPRGIHPADRPRVFAEMPRLFEVGRHADEYRFLHKDGSYRWMRDELVLQRDELGRPRSILGTWRDVTESRRLQEQLLISERMASMGTLAAGIAHEINNPLACVMANLELAERWVAERAARLGLAGELTEVRAELQDALEAGRTIRTIVSDLKVFSRSQAEELGPVEVRPVLESTLRMAWNEIRHRARLVKDYGETPPVLASDSRLGQVFLNLVVNAAQAIGEGHAQDNEIRVRTWTEANGTVVVEIADTGPGMSPEVLGQLFTPFFTTKPVGIGTGLGLTICQRIVKGFGGSLDVTSEVGRGTAFRVSLQPSLGEAPAPRPVVRDPGAARRGRILVVDDEPLIGTVVQRVLSSQHDVEAVLSGAEALERIHAGERFDVIVSDLMMPEMTGMELHAELARFAPEQADRMVFVCGGAFTAAARAFLAATPQPHLEKPFDVSQLRALINERLLSS